MASQETTTCLTHGLQLQRVFNLLLLLHILSQLILGQLLTSGVGAATRDKPAKPGSPSVPVRAVDPLPDPLPERAIRRFGTAQYRHGDLIVGLTVSNDDRFAVAFGIRPGGSRRLNRAHIYDLRDGQRLAKFAADAESLFSFEAVAFSPDGKTLATKQHRGIHFHDPKTGDEIDKIRVYMGDRDITYWLTFSPDGSKIALSTGFRDVQIIDRKSKKMLHKFTHEWTVYAGVFSPDGKLFAAGDHQFVRLWDVGTGKEVRRINAVKGRMGTLAFSPDGKTLAGGGGWLCLWNVASGQVRHLFPTNGDQIRSVAFTHDGKTIASAGATIRLYDVATKKERLRIPGPAHSLYFSPSDEVLTAAVGGAIHRWDTQTGKFLTPQGCDSGVDQIELASRTLVTRDQAGGVHLWDRATGKHRDQLKMEKRRELAVSPDGRYLAMSEKDPSITFLDPKQDIGPLGGNKLKLYDLESRQYIERFAGFEGDSQFMEFAHDGKTLVTVDRRDGKVRLWDVATGKESRSCYVVPDDELKKPYRISGSELSPDGKTLAVAYRPDGTSELASLRMWDITTGKELAQLSGHANKIHGLTFSPDGRFLASCTQSPSGSGVANRFFVWSVRSGRQILRFSDKAISANRVAFSSDSRMLASASLGGTVHVWEVASWTPRAKIQAHRDHISALEFAPDGTLFSGSLDSTIMAWNVRPGGTLGHKAVEDMPLSKAWLKLLVLKAEPAHAVQGRMLATPKETVKFLAEHLRPIAKVDTKRVAKLLADLGDERLATREAAFRELPELGHQIEPMLRETLAKTQSLEVHNRAQALLAQLELTVASPAERRLLRAIEVLEWLGTPPARELLSKLAKGEPNALLTRNSATAVERLTAPGK